MNRMTLESFAESSRRTSVGYQIKSYDGGKATSGGDGDDSLDLFSRVTQRSSGDQITWEKVASEPGRIGRGMEDLFDSEVGKNDYDWLLTPPETPLCSSVMANESTFSSNSLSVEVPLSSAVLPATARETVSSGPRGRATARSVSTTRPSRISSPQTDNSFPARPVRSSSVTRPSVSCSYSSISFSSNNRTSMLNTSSASITSWRPSTPGRSLNRPISNSTLTTKPFSSSIPARSSTSSTFGRPKPSNTTNISRPSSSSSSSSSTRPVNSRIPTPALTQPNLNSISTTRTASSNSRPSSPNSSRPQTPKSNSKIGSRANSQPSSPTTRPASNSRPSSPNSSRPWTPSNSNSKIGPRTNSQPSTPTRRPASISRPSSPNSSRPQTPSHSNSNSNSNSNSKIGSLANSQPSTPTKRPASSGGPSALTTTIRIPAINRRPGSHPSSPSPRSCAPVRAVDPPNFPTDAPPNLRMQLPARSASTGQTRPGVAVALNSNSAPAATNKRNYTPPVGSRARFPENSLEDNSTKLHGSNDHEFASDNGLLRPAKLVSDSTGFGRNISKKSLDMVLRHMDIRQGMNGLRTSTLFPQSIRSTSTKTPPPRKSDHIVPLSHDDSLHDSHSFNGSFSESVDFAPGSLKPLDWQPSPTNRDDSELDLLQGSMRYDDFILKGEDLNNMNWLHSAEDNSDQSPDRFELLPEPFGLL